LHYQLSWIIVFLFECILIYGLSFLNIATYGYVTDCFRDHAPEALTSLNIGGAYEFGMLSLALHSTYSGLNFLIAKWLQTDGPLKVFSVIGTTHILAISLTIPMYIFGKRARSWIARNKFYQKVLRG
jgi:hypothetical protein